MSPFQFSRLRQLFDVCAHHRICVRLRRLAAWIFELAGGAIGDFDDTCVPKSQRETAFTLAALHQWDIGIDDPRCITTAEDVRKKCSSRRIIY